MQLKVFKAIVKNKQNTPFFLLKQFCLLKTDFLEQFFKLRFVEKSHKFSSSEKCLNKKNAHAVQKCMLTKT